MVSPISVDSDFDSYTLQMTMDTSNLALSQNRITLNITRCPSGYGVVRNELLCRTCDEGTYNLDSFPTNECKSCDPAENPGVHCFDGGIFISRGVWIGFENETIISATCPASLCCDPTDGQYCDYVEDQQSLCAMNRDSGSFLCGKCVDGFSESMISANCIECGKNVNWNYLSVPISMATLWTMIILCTNRETTNDAEGHHHALRIMKDKLVPLGNVIIYYQQALSQLLSESGWTYFGIAFLGLFDISARNVAAGTKKKGSGMEWCFIHGLDAKSKILWDLLTPFLVYLLMLFVFLFSRFILRKPLRIWKKAVNFESAVLAAYIKIIGTVINTLFKLMSCQSVGTHSVHFYFGYEMCYGPTWIMAMVFLLMIAMSFGAVFVFGARMANDHRYDPNTFIFKLCQRYKPEYWYWEYVIFVRRIVIAYFAMSAGGVVSKSVFQSFMVVFLTIHWRLFPFVSSEANLAEGILLCGLMIVISSQILMESSDKIFFSIQLTMMVVLPFVLLMYFVLPILSRLCRKYIHRSSAAKSRGASTGDLSAPLLSESDNDGLIGAVPMLSIREDEDPLRKMVDDAVSGDVMARTDEVAADEIIEMHNADIVENK